MPNQQRNLLQWQAKTGNKASGTVTLAYVESDFDRFFSAPPLPAQGQSIADKRCLSWGYKKAIPFEFVNTSCNQFEPDGSCSESLVTQEYQCE